MPEIKSTCCYCGVGCGVVRDVGCDVVRVVGRGVELLDAFSIAVVPLELDGRV